MKARAPAPGREPSIFCQGFQPVVLAFNNFDFSSSSWTTVTLFAVDTPPAGVQHTYTANWYVNTGGMSTSEGVYTENLAAIELKR